MLNPTPSSRLIDAQGRPYFLWDEEHTTLEDFLSRLRGSDPDARGYAVGKLMRQAKPDDVFTFVTKREIAALWPKIVIHLGEEREFWTWTLRGWGVLEDADG